MNDSALQPANLDTYPNTPQRKKTRSVLFFYALLWTVLVAAGIAGAKAYSDHIQQQVKTDVERQTASQIAVMQQDYDSRMSKLEIDYKAQLTQMEGKIQALNELLTFAKDNAASKTDNSNKLYTQLAEVKKQLSELKKTLDVLK
jgi:outer membrane phospholipase A